MSSKFVDCKSCKLIVTRVKLICYVIEGMCHVKFGKFQKGVLLLWGVTQKRVMFLPLPVERVG